MKKIKNLNQAEDALYRIAEIESQMKNFESVRSDVINRANDEFKLSVSGMQAELDELVSHLHDFADEHRDEIIPDGKKSVELSNGTLGYRQNPDSVEVSEKTADLLIDAGFGMMVRIKKEPVKASLKGMSDAELARFEVKRIPGQESFYAKAVEFRRCDSASHQTA
jgi:phage host-nuclease inhibitor protein Gam